MSTGIECEKRNAPPNASLSAAAVADSLAPRPSSGAQVGDLDEHRRANRVRWTVEKNERYRHLDLPDDLFAAILATLPGRADRDLDAPLFPDLDDCDRDLAGARPALHRRPDRGEFLRGRRRICRSEPVPFVLTLEYSISSREVWT